MNSTFIVGNLAKDPELRYSSGDNKLAICRFTVADNDGYGDNQQTSWIPVVVFGKLAENCDRYLAKGRAVAVVGRIQTGSYEKDGRRIKTTEVVANKVKFLGGGQHQQQGSAPATDAPPAETQIEADIPEGFSLINDDDIPF